MAVKNTRPAGEAGYREAAARANNRRDKGVSAKETLDTTGFVKKGAAPTTKTKTTGSGGVKNQNTAPKSYADISREIWEDNERQAIKQGARLGLSPQESIRAFSGNISNTNYMKKAANALGSVTKTPYSYEDTSARDSYLASLQAQLNAQTAAYDQLLAYNQQMYDAQQKQAAQQREDNARRAYIAKEMALKNLPGQLAREGINGGLAETSYVRLNNRYNSSLADADNAYSDAVNQAYLDMIQANRQPQQGLANARATYQSGLANAPAAKTIRGVKEKDTGNPGAFWDSMNRLGYTDEQIEKIWNSRK